MATQTLYAVLGVEAEATPEEISAAYAARQAALAGDVDALSLLRVAYDTLGSPELRAAYDRKLARQAAAAPVVMLESAPARGSYRWLLVLLIAGAAVWWWKTRLAMPAAAPVIAASPARPAGQGAAPVAAVPTLTAEEMALAQEEIQNSNAPVVAQAAGTAAAGGAPPVGRQVEIILPTRPQRTAPFDPQYLAWSAFKIRQRNSSGSGVLIAPDKILTNCHVLAGGATNAIVVIHSMTNRVARVEKYARLEGEDACLLYAPGAGGDVIDWGNSNDLKEGDTVYTFGHPGGSQDLISSEGQFLARVELGGDTFLKTANYCRPGSSGGPLLDASGRLVGIITAGQVFRSRGGEVAGYGACYSVTEATARNLLSRSMFPIGFAPAQYLK